MNNTKKLPFEIPLQFFASEDMSVSDSADVSTDMGVASPEADNIEDTPSAVNTFDGNQVEEEFEKLIKGGKYEDAFKKRTQSIIDKRFKTLKALESSQAKQQPIMDFLSEKYGIDSSDPSLLLEKMQNESKEKSGIDNGSAEKTETNTREQIIAAKAQKLSRHWAEEGKELKKVFPDFDFKTELQNPIFTSLLKSGLPLRKVYMAVHSDELIRSAVQGTAIKVAEQTMKSIRAQGSRAAENGLHNGAGFVRKTDVSSLTGQEIRSILKQVENGTKIRF